MKTVSILFPRVIQPVSDNLVDCAIEICWYFLAEFGNPNTLRDYDTAVVRLDITIYESQ